MLTGRRRLLSAARTARGSAYGWLTRSALCRSASTATSPAPETGVQVSDPLLLYFSLGKLIMLQLDAGQSPRSAGESSRWLPAPLARLSALAPSHYSRPGQDPEGRGAAESARAGAQARRRLWNGRRRPLTLPMLPQIRKLHADLLDYQPPVQLVTLLDSIRSLPSKSNSQAVTKSASSGWPAWPFRRSALSSLGPGLSDAEEQERQHLLALSDKEKTTQLVKALKAHEGLEDLDTPKGFLLTGPPGTGKSLVMDLFFQSLPVASKTRHHYHAFLLWIYQGVHRALEKQRLENEAEEKAMNELYQSGGNKGYPWSRREEMKARAISQGWCVLETLRWYAASRRSLNPSPHPPAGNLSLPVRINGVLTFRPFQPAMLILSAPCRWSLRARPDLEHARVCSRAGRPRPDQDPRLAPRLRRDPARRYRRSGTRQPGYVLVLATRWRCRGHFEPGPRRSVRCAAL